MSIGVGGIQVRLMRPIITVDRPAARAARFTVEDLVVAISARQRLKARISRDGRLKLPGGAVHVEVYSIDWRRVGYGTSSRIETREVVRAHLVVRTIPARAAANGAGGNPIARLAARDAGVNSEPKAQAAHGGDFTSKEGVVSDISIDDSEMIRCGPALALDLAVERLRVILASRRVMI